MSAQTKRTNLNSVREIMRITTRDDAIPMKDVPDGTEIDMVAYVVQEITKDRGEDPSGEVFDSIMVLDRENRVYATRSETFIDKIDEIISALREAGEPVDDLNENPLRIRITHQKSRQGNTFVSCSLA